jgi:isoleucyl-tRNA synthetase
LVANSNGITVALDITISSELKKQGNCQRISKQNSEYRKDSGFEVTDKIKVQKEMEFFRGDSCKRSVY